MAAERRLHSVTLRLTKSELDAFKGKAEDDSLDLSSVIRMLALRELRWQEAKQRDAFPAEVAQPDTVVRMNSHDVVIPLQEAASRMGVNTRRARNILSRASVRPVRTRDGIGYRLDEVMATRARAS